MKKNKSKVILPAIAFFIIGAVLGGITKRLLCATTEEKIQEIHLTRYVKVDELRKKAVEGNLEDYKLLKWYFSGRGYKEDLFYYSLIMAEKYGYTPAYRDMYNSIIAVHEKYKLQKDDEFLKILKYCKRMEDKGEIKKSK